MIVTQSESVEELPEAEYKILVITQNNIDLELIKKSLEAMGHCRVYEAGNLKSAFKITSHFDIDLIIVDEKLPSAEGFAIIDRLNQRKILKDVPKILLITSSFKKERYDSYRDINLDFLRKPVDTVMLKARVNTLFKNMHKRRKHSIFEEMMSEKIEEAKAFLGIYRSFLDVDENILFIYDKKRNRVVEGNRVFLRFFEDIEDVNKVLVRKHLFKKFVPFLKDANYLNHYPFEEWSKIVGVTEGFHFALKIKKDGTLYTFTMLQKRVEINHHEMYVVKLLNTHNYFRKEENEDIVKLDNSARIEINEELGSIKEEVDLEEEKRSYQKIYLSLRKISEIINPHKKEDLLEIDEAPQRPINAYFVIASLLKSYASYKTLFLNGEKVDKMLEENREEIYVVVDPNALLDTVKGIIDSYFTAPVQYDKRRIRVDIYRYGDELKVEIRTSERKEKVREKSVIEKLLHKEKLRYNDESAMDILPKNVQKAVEVLKAEVDHFSSDGETIFLVKVPLLKKS